MAEEKDVLEHGLKFNGEKLKELEPVLDKWIEVVEKYPETYFIRYPETTSPEKYSDAIWWHTERANVGMLTAAAWKTEHWIALEEYSATKHKGEVESTGRCDLYIGKRSRNIITDSFALEAKVAGQNIEKNGTEQIAAQFHFKNRGKQKVVKTAWDDADALSEAEAKKRIAACFVVPWIHSKNVNGNGVSKQLMAWLKVVKKMPDVDALAWVFPKQNRNLKSTYEKNNKDYYYPGVVLILREYVKKK